jgi:Holliday junction resolvasome RuvABC endonuclease subunit
MADNFGITMKIVGIDPGLQVCGYACVEADNGGQKNCRIVGWALAHADNC